MPTIELEKNKNRIGCKQPSGDCPVGKRVDCYCTHNKYCNHQLLNLKTEIFIQEKINKLF
jgi:hypothetical protein